MTARSRRTLKLIWVMPAERGDDVFRRTSVSLSDDRRFRRRHPRRHRRARPLPSELPDRDRRHLDLARRSARSALSGHARSLSSPPAKRGVHCVLAATVSRGCPGEPDDPICTPIAGSSHDRPLDERIAAALQHVRSRRKDGAGRRRAVLALSARQRSPHGRDLRLHRFSEKVRRLRPLQELLHEAARRCGSGLRDA